MINLYRNHQLNRRGFTVVELMIATAVFGTILLLTSGVIVQLSKQFYKGVVTSRTQEVARTISEEIANNIQFSASEPRELTAVGADVSAWCIADRRYAFVQSRQLGNDPSQTPGVMVRSQDCSDTTPPNPLVPAAPDVEMIGEGMRLVNMEIVPVDAADEIWMVRVRVAHGDDELLCSPSVAGDCDSPNTSPHLANTDLMCKGLPGSEFCSVAEFTVTVVRRL